MLRRGWWRGARTGWHFGRLLCSSDRIDHQIDTIVCRARFVSRPDLDGVAAERWRKEPLSVETV